VAANRDTTAPAITRVNLPGSTSIDIARGGLDVFQGLASGPTVVVNLLGGLGGYISASGVPAALTGDGAGGSLLVLGSGHSIDFTNVTPSVFHAANFQVG
jgi:hypothetical protein